MAMFNDGIKPSEPTAKPKNSRKDLQKIEICEDCGQEFTRENMRGARHGGWLCVNCWEETTGNVAPPPLPLMRSPGPGQQKTE